MLSERLTNLRIENHLTQDEMAGILDVKRQTYGAYERNVSSPDLQTLIKLADHFKVSTDYLLGLTDIRSGNADDIAMGKKLGLSADAISALATKWLKPEETEAELKLPDGSVAKYRSSGFKDVPAPIEVSEFISHELFRRFILSLKSMRAMDGGSATFVKTKMLLKLLGNRGMWEFFRQQTIKFADEIITSIAPKPEKNDVETINSFLLDIAGIEEKELWLGYLAAEPDQEGILRDPNGNFYLKDGRFYAASFDEINAEKEAADAQHNEAPE